MRSSSGGNDAAAVGATVKAPVGEESAANPLGSVVWFTKGNAIPSMITILGEGSGFTGTGITAPAFAPEKAANSETCGVGPTTPTPPTNSPFLNGGTPPGLTALGSLSATSALPVMMPNPTPPDNDCACGTV